MSGTAGYGDRTWISVDEVEKRTNKNKSNTNPIAEQPKPGKTEVLNVVKKGKGRDQDGAVFIAGSR